VRLASPVFDAAGALFVVSTETGEIHQVVSDAYGATSLQHCESTFGGAAVAFDPEGTMYVCDLTQGAILQQGADKSFGTFVGDYEAKQLKGPTAIEIDSRGNMFFCDSGPFGETTLQAPRGSVFTISADGQLLQPLALECLAHPCGLAVLRDGGVIVAEMMANRLLRFVQRPTGVYHCSVFYQFSGGIGPSAIAYDEDNLYIARFDFAAAGKKGVVSQITAAGVHVRDFELPAAELTGIAVDKAAKALVVTEASSSSVYRISL